MRPWEQTETDLTAMVGRRLESTGASEPVLAAFAGADPLLSAWLRPYEDGCWDEPLVELLGLTAPLGADRLAFAAGGRAWALDGPAPPVGVGQLDSRKRVLVVHLVDGSTSPPAVRSVLHPLSPRGSGLRWEGAIHLEGGQGGLAELLLAGCGLSRELAGTTPAEEVVEQAMRCVALGHVLEFAPAASARVPGLDALVPAVEP